MIIKEIIVNRIDKICNCIYDLFGKFILNGLIKQNIEIKIFKQIKKSFFMHIS